MTVNYSKKAEKKNLGLVAMVDWRNDRREMRYYMYSCRPPYFVVK